MFAVLACILFVLRFFNVDFDGKDLLYLGLASLALHFAYPVGIPVARTRAE